MSTWEISKNVHNDLVKHGKSPKRTNGSLFNLFNSNGVILLLSADKTLGYFFVPNGPRMV